MSRPSTRLLTLLEVLQDRPGIAGRELAELLQVDERTVRRYATRLQELGIPVEAERGRAGGYRLRPGYKLPPLMLTDDEAAAVVLGLVFARRYGVVAAEPAVETALAKLQRVLPEQVRERVRAVQETLGFTRRVWAAGAPPATDTVLVLADAARRRRRVRLTYAAFSGERTERELDPYGLVVHGSRWYVAGHDHLRGALRTFRVDRVAEVAPLDVRAEPPPADFDAVEHVTRSLANAPWRRPAEVVLVGTTLDAARQRVPPTFGELEDDGDGRVRVRAQTADLEQFVRVLVVMGFRFEVVGPVELAAAVQTVAGQLDEAIATAGAVTPARARTDAGAPTAARP